MTLLWFSPDFLPPLFSGFFPGIVSSRSSVSSSPVVSGLVFPGILQVCRIHVSPVVSKRGVFPGGLQGCGFSSFLVVASLGVFPGSIFQVLCIIHFSPGVVSGCGIFPGILQVLLIRFPCYRPAVPSLE